MATAYAILVWHDDPEAGELKGPYHRLLSEVKARARRLVNEEGWTHATVVTLQEVGDDGA